MGNLLCLNTFRISPSTVRICAGLTSGTVEIRDLDCNHKRLTTPFPGFRVDSDTPAIPHALAFDVSANDLILVDRQCGRLYVMASVDCPSA